MVTSIGEYNMHHCSIGYSDVLRIDSEHLELVGHNILEADDISIVVTRIGQFNQLC